MELRLDLSRELEELEIHVEEDYSCKLNSEKINSIERKIDY